MRQPRLFRAIYIALCGSAVLVPVAAAAAGHTVIVASLLPLTAALLALTVAAINSDFQFVLGKRNIVFSPYLAPIGIAAIALPPVMAMLVCLVAFMCDFATLRQPGERWKLPIDASVNGWSVFLVSIVFASWAPEPSAMLMLPMAIVAAVGVELVFTALFFVVFESYRRGDGMSLLRTGGAMAVFEVCAAALGIVLALPFVQHAGLTLAVLGGFQLLIMLAARVSASESLHRMKSQHLHDVFQRYVPSHVADELAERGQEVRLGGEQREVTVLFCDIRGFTAWAEHEEPETVITELNWLLRELSAAVIYADGTLDKFTGDGLMAFWGAPLDQPDHATKAATAALDMLMRLEVTNDDRVRRGLPPFDIGIGLHSGKAVIGNIGHEDRLDYTAIGDTVNLSARLEAATKEVGSPLLMSAATQAQLIDDLRQFCVSAGKVTVKGRQQPVEVFVLGDVAAALDDAGAPGDEAAADRHHGAA